MKGDVVLVGQHLIVIPHHIGVTGGVFVIDPTVGRTMMNDQWRGDTTSVVLLGPARCQTEQGRVVRVQSFHLLMMMAPLFGLRVRDALEQAGTEACQVLSPVDLTRRRRRQ